MKNTGLSKLAFNTLDRITDLYPAFGSQVFQKVFLFLLGSKTLYHILLKKYQEKLLDTKDFNKILLVADVNIGDAINTQSAIEVLRGVFPNSQIDYVCSKTGGELLTHFPFVNNVFSVYSNSGLPLEEDAKKINKIAEEGNYSLILNMSPFLGKKILNCNANVIHLYIVFTSYIIYLFNKHSKSLNLSLATYTFYKNFFTPYVNSLLPESCTSNELYTDSTYYGNNVYVSNEDVESAKSFMVTNNLYGKNNIVLFNLTGTVKYSTIPVELQLETISDVALSDEINAVIIFKGNSTVDIESQVKNRIPSALAGKIISIPNTFSIGWFTALIDFCDMFFSGDTGTVHIAASQKINYDSEKFGHSAANQMVSSKVFNGDSPCRNITCINRLAKTCKVVRCFLGLNGGYMSSYIISYFKNLNNKVIFPEKQN